MTAVDIAVSLLGLAIGFGALGYAISLPKSSRQGHQNGRSEHQHTSWDDVKASRSDRADNPRDDGSDPTPARQK